MREHGLDQAIANETSHIIKRGFGCLVIIAMLAGAAWLGYGLLKPLFDNADPILVEMASKILDVLGRIVAAVLLLIGGLIGLNVWLGIDPPKEETNGEQS